MERADMSVSVLQGGFKSSIQLVFKVDIDMHRSVAKIVTRWTGMSNR